MSGPVAQLGLMGIFVLMVPESACIPIPSEVTLLSAGFGVHEGWFGFPEAVAAATAGNLVGSLAAYWFGRRAGMHRLPPGGAAIVRRCERLLERRAAVFTARLLPLARTFVSLPAGYARIPFWRFTAMTIAGCAIWSGAFILAGGLAGAGWRVIAATTGHVSIALLALTAVALVLTKRRRAGRRASGESPARTPRTGAGSASRG